MEIRRDEKKQERERREEKSRRTFFLSFFFFFRMVNFSWPSKALFWSEKEGRKEGGEGAGSPSSRNRRANT